VNDEKGRIWKTKEVISVKVIAYLIILMETLRKITRNLKHDSC
jgi:hypothetical protein